MTARSGLFDTLATKLDKLKDKSFGAPAQERLNQRLESEQVADVEYQPGKCARPYRLVILRKNISVEKGREFWSNHHDPDNPGNYKPELGTVRHEVRNAGHRKW